MSKTRSQKSQSIPESASVKDDNILCCVCDAVVQIEPSDLYDELVKYASKSKNMKFYCDNCVKHADGFKDVVKSNSKIVDNEAASLRNMISTSFSDVVKKDLNVVSKEVISVRRTIEVANEVKARENNIVLLNFSKDLDVAKDRGNVLGFLRSLTDESLKDEDILKIFRQGKKPSVSSPPRPVIVKFINLSAKEKMRRLFRLALLDEKMREVRISDDLTTDQRLQLKKLGLEAKTQKSKDGHFLYRNVFKVKKIELPVVNSFESLAIKFRCGKKTILLLAVYRPGSVPITPAIFDELTSLLEQISLLADYVILTGDLNVHLEKAGNTHSIRIEVAGDFNIHVETSSDIYATALADIFSSFDLVNRINQSTHVLGGTLDLIVTSDGFLLEDILVYLSGIYSDHGLVTGQFLINPTPVIFKKSWIRSWKRVDKKRLTELLRCSPISKHYSQDDDVELGFKIFNEELLKVADDVALLHAKTCQFKNNSKYLWQTINKLLGKETSVENEVGSMHSADDFKKFFADKLKVTEKSTECFNFPVISTNTNIMFPLESFPVLTEEQILLILLKLLIRHLRSHAHSTQYRRMYSKNMLTVLLFT
ncbi:hypothetical protein HELRODRAFT_158326 [Helobdella robusta]|uniref:Endonuclease/exonuclease/phosphatase domain-containing protein n=1 Tax=Helobdella robusta TaxID=6412 RepID=T1EMN6_HELRO|nr:hypothetical protein HELRODRAFT_158326 [Helobdella robusta]ESO11961.1 hypothetical protein HELRODRAFT_158326 [Helobdella robusta]